jgi:hypothetical protein
VKEIIMTILFTVIRLPGVMTVTPFSAFLALFLIIRGFAIAALPWMLDL